MGQCSTNPSTGSVSTKGTQLDFPLLQLFGEASLCIREQLDNQLGGHQQPQHCSLLHRSAVN